MIRHFTTGIDIGTYQVKVVISEHIKNKDKHFPKIIGTGYAESRGLRHGYIINSNDVLRSIKKAVAQAEKEAETRIRRAFISIGGVGIDELRAKADIAVSRPDGDVTALDVENVLSKCEESVAQKIVNKKIIHVIPMRYKVDGEVVLGNRPIGLSGNKLEVETLFITCFEQHLNDLIKTVEEVGIEVEDVMASPIAGSLVTLSRAQKIAGCVLANIGAETVSIVVFENNFPISVKVFPTGSSDITNAIALSLRISPEEAERIKLGSITNTDYSERQLEQIIVDRMRDIFNLIESHLKKINKSGLLPAGIILTGGGSGMTTIEDLARASLKIPSRIGEVHTGGQPKNLVRDSSWAVAYGLCIWGFTADDDGFGIKMAKKGAGSVATWFRQFLP